MESKKDIIKKLIKENINKNVNDIYWEIHDKLKLDSNYDDIVELYKKEINHRMYLFFCKEINTLDLSIDFNKFYEEMISKDEFKYKIELSKKLQNVYEEEMNFSCFSIFKKYNYEKKLYNIYNILSIDELNKLNN